MKNLHTRVVGICRDRAISNPIPTYLKELSLLSEDLLGAVFNLLGNLLRC